MMLLKSWWVKASRVMPVRRDMVAAKSMRARLPGVLRHQHSEVIALLIPKSGHGLLQSSFGADFSLVSGVGAVHQITHGQFPQRS